MTEVEQFLASQVLHRCERMNSNLREDQCKSNKQSGRYISCSGCSGLGEKIDMSSPRGTCTKCKRENLTLPQGGLCGKCYGEKRKAEGKQLPPSKKSKGIKKTSSKPAISLEQMEEKTKVIPENSQTSQRYPLSIVQDEPATSAEITHSDDAAYLRGLFDAKLNEWLPELSGATDLYTYHQRFLDMADAIRSLGY
jgi:hypothetical protein